MKTLLEIQKELRDIVPDGLDLAFTAIKAYLTNGADKYNELILLESRYRDINKQLLQEGILSNEEAQREINKVRKAVMDFIDDMNEEDLQKQGASGVPSAPNIYNGEVLYRIPKEMKLKEEVKCIVRVAFTKQALLEGLEKMEGDVVKDVRIGDVMAVELIDPNATKSFDIRALDPNPVQYLEKDLATEWFFYVKPLLEGTFPLVLKISVIEIKDGIERKRNVVLEEKIHIVSTEPAPEAAGKGFTASGYALNFSGAQGVVSNIPKGPSFPRAPSTIVQPSPAMPSPGGSSPLRKLSMVMSVLLVLIVATWAIQSYFLNPEKGIKGDWNKTVAENSRPGFEEFVKNHPNSPEAVIANDKLASIETVFWEENVLSALMASPADPLYGSRAMAGVKVYLSEYPDGRYVAEALLLLERFENPAYKDVVFSWQLLDTVLRVSHDGGFAPFQFSMLQDGQVAQEVRRDSIGSFSLPLKNLKPGNYEMRLLDSEGRIVTAPITIEAPKTGAVDKPKDSKGVAKPKPERPGKPTPKPPAPTPTDKKPSVSENENQDKNTAPTTDPNAPVPMKSAARLPAYKGCSNSNKGKEVKCTERRIRQFIDDKLKYPQQASAKGIQGTVVIHFIVEKDGSVTDVKAANDIGGGCAAEAERIVRQMPLFKPGLNSKGDAVRVLYALPITFRLF